MAKPPKPKAKFLTFKISPKVIKQPRTGIKAVTTSGSIRTTSNKQYVDITLTPPKDKKVKSKARYLTGGRTNVVTFQWKYGVSKNKDVGTYKVRAQLVENRKQVRSDTFRVK
ncbi:MAG: hypothetical protein IIA83_08145 [Thaumarchaeota archaeon]|nr:hypothetical protein [Nitrososphaerota archaeon]